MKASPIPIRLPGNRGACSPQKTPRLALAIFWLIIAAAIMPARVLAYPSRYAIGLSVPQYLALAATNAAEGYRPISLDANGPTNNPSIAAVWINDGFTNWTTIVGLTRAQYTSQSSTLSAQGYRTLCVDAYGDAPNECYVAVWVNDSYVSAGWAEIHGVSESAYNTAWQNYSTAGYRPIWISVIGTNGAPAFSGAWVNDHAPGYWTYWDMSAFNVGANVTNILAAGGRPICLSGYGPANAMLFGGHWIYDEQPAWTWNFQLTAAAFQAATNDLAAGGYRPAFINEYGPAASPRYSSAWVRDPEPKVFTITGLPNANAAAVDTEMNNYMTLRNISRGAVAVTQNGRLVFHHAYTWAPAGETPTQLTNLFRIASLSKAFTSAGILQLIQAGKIDIDQTLDTILDLSSVNDPRFRQVTIRDLLQHRGGWDRGVSFDPMFYDTEVSAGTGQPLPTTPQVIVDFMKGVALDHDPGTIYAYSNFGYCLLGRVIEAITGMPYYQYIETNVLQPAGIWDMRPGKPLAADADPAEVDYEDQLRRVVPSVMGATSPAYVPVQYGGWNISSMDSHGAWLATAADLVRFSSSFDNPANNPLFSSAMFDLLVSRPPSEDPNSASYYGAGWLARPLGNGAYNLWHDGSLDGTFSYSVRLANGICWAVVFNRRDVIGKVPDFENIDPEMNSAIGSVASWPTGDLFDSNADGLLDAWQIHYFGSIDSPNAAPSADPFGVGYDNLSAYVNGTDPTKPGSGERLLALPGAPNGQSLILKWMALRGRLYSLETTTTLVPGNWQPVAAATGITGDNTTHSLAYPIAGSRFFRLRVQIQRP